MKLKESANYLANPDADYNFQLIQIEMQRIDIYLQKAIRQWQLAGQDPADKFRGLYVTSDEVSGLVGRKFAQNWGSGVSLPPKEEKKYSNELARLQKEARILQEKAVQAGVSLKLVDLIGGFGLSPFEYDAFLICLAPALDLRYERIYAYLQDDVTRKVPSANLILDLLITNVTDRLQALDYFRSHGTLLRYGLLGRVKTDANLSQPNLRHEYIVPQEVLSWLMGSYRPADVYADCFLFGDLETEPVDALSFDQNLLDSLDKIIDQRPLFAFYGADVQRKKAAAFQIAGYVGRTLLEINLDICKAAGELDRKVLQLAMRDTVLTQAIPYFSGWDCWLDEDGALPGHILSEIDGYLGPVIVSSVHPWRMTSNSSSRPVIQWSFELPDSAQRLQLWRHYLGSNGSVPAESLVLIAGQFALTSAQIRDAVGTAKNLAFQEVRQISADDLFEAARQHSAHHLDNLAVKLKPRYDWTDIVLPVEELAVLKEITGTVRERPRVLDGWGLGKKLVSSAGVSALFAGPPGTGKTLAAQVIAAELGMDLYKIDLSTVVSKYIGETEKNLERIFTQAHNSNTILFFDEADAIFGKRSEVKDAHDRYANIEVGYLLQRMESYDGVVILATNLRANLDEAFTRRLQFVVNFPFPDKDERLSIWKVLIPSTLPCDENIDLQMLANRFELTGGSIRNVIVSAAYLAANESSQVSNRHLIHGVRRELQKMGRLIDEKSLELD